MSYNWAESKAKNAKEWNVWKITKLANTRIVFNNSLASYDLEKELKQRHN